LPRGLAMNGTLLSSLTRIFARSVHAFYAMRERIRTSTVVSGQKPWRQR
jgi:hypothetical protein